MPPGSECAGRDSLWEIASTGEMHGERAGGRAAANRLTAAARKSGQVWCTVWRRSPTSRCAHTVRAAHSQLVAQRVLTSWNTRSTDEALWNSFRRRRAEYRAVETSRYESQVSKHLTQGPAVLYSTGSWKTEYDCLVHSYRVQLQTSQKHSKDFYLHLPVWKRNGPLDLGLRHVIV